MAKSREVPFKVPLTVTSNCGGCPICGSKKVTRDIYGGTYTYLCGYSGSGGNATTQCQGKYFEQWLPGGEAVEPSIWEGVW